MALSPGAVQHSLSLLFSSQTKIRFVCCLQTAESYSGKLYTVPNKSQMAFEP